LHDSVEHCAASASLGTELQVPGLNGDEKLKIPEGTQSGAVFRIKAKVSPIRAGAARRPVLPRTGVDANKADARAT